MPIHIASSGGGGSLRVLDNGDVVGEVDALNYITAADEVSVALDAVSTTQLNIFHPAQSLVSDWDTSNGITNANVNATPTTNRVIGTPTDESGSPSAANPFYTGGWAGTANPTTNTNVIVISPPGLVRFDNNTSTTFTINITQGAEELSNTTTSVITGNGAYTEGQTTVTISNDAVNGPGRQANVSVSINLRNLLPTGGRVRIAITHNNVTVNNTFTQELFFDSQPGTNALSTGVPTIALNTPSTYQTSGVHHLTNGTTWDWTLPDIDNAFADSCPVTPLQLSSAELAIVTDQINASGLASTVWDEQDQVLNGTLTSTVNNVVTCGAADLNSDFADWGLVSRDSLDLEVLLCTELASSDYLETFKDEVYRVDAGLTPWDSTAVITDDDAVVACGKLLRHGENYQNFIPHGVGGRNNPDYSATGAADQVYIRRFPDGGLARQNGTIVFTGLASDVGVSLEASLDGVTWWDLTSDYLGGSLSPAFPGMKVSGTMPTINFTLGTVFTTGQMYLRVTLSSPVEITQIQLTWT